MLETDVLLFLYPECINIRVEGRHEDAATRNRDAAEVRPGGHGVAARIQLLAGRAVEGVEHRIANMLRGAFGGTEQRAIALRLARELAVRDREHKAARNDRRLRQI